MLAEHNLEAMLLVNTEDEKGCRFDVPISGEHNL
jgi:hypothetical protein